MCNCILYSFFTHCKSKIVNIKKIEIHVGTVGTVGIWPPSSIPNAEIMTLITVIMNTIIVTTLLTMLAIFCLCR